MGATEVRAREIGVPQVRTNKSCVTEISITEVRALEVGTPKVYPGKTTLSEVAPAQKGIPQIGRVNSDITSPEFDARKFGSREVRAR
jgi:hypothetical protein